MIARRHHIVSKSRSRDASGKKCQHLNNSLTVIKKHILTMFAYVWIWMFVNFFNVEQFSPIKCLARCSVLYCRVVCVNDEVTLRGKSERVLSTTERRSK